MEIHEVIAKKQTTEDQIMELIQLFENDTGLAVRGIEKAYSFSFVMADREVFGKPEIRLEVSLDFINKNGDRDSA